MDKREALEICLKVYRECMENEDCFNCPFGEYYRGIKFCVLSHPDDDVIVKLVEDKLKRISEAPEQKPLVPLENVKATTTLYAKAPISAEELEKQLKALLPQKLALEPLPEKDGPIQMPESSKPDNVNHPKHYCKGGIECIDAIRAAVSDLQGIEAVYAGKVIKYVWRFKGKNGLEDLKKAKRCLEWLIEEVGKNANKA